MDVVARAQPVDTWLIGGKGSAFDPRGLYNDPPVCGEAKDYAMQVCPYLAMPDKLTACAGDDALATLAAMGLTQVEVDVGVYV